MTEPQPLKARPFQFSGNAVEYFRIWIVNLALTIATLGIYSAWAKVRRKRYFYGHTVVDGVAFDYLAKPAQILKGRMIAAGFFIAYVVAERVSPFLALGMFVLLFLFMPWLIVRSLTFNARYSSHRGLRFNFTGSVGEAAKLFIFYPILIVFTLGLITPYLAYKQRAFVANRHHYGRVAFQLDTDAPLVREYYKTYGVALLMLILPLALMVAAMTQMPRPAANGQMDPDAVRAAMNALATGVAVFYFGIYIAFGYVQTRTANLIFNHLGLGGLRFRSNLRVRDMLWIYASNLIAIICTLGLLIPWAQVRLARYRAAHLTLLADERYDRFLAARVDDAKATGEEMAEMFDIDVGA